MLFRNSDGQALFELALALSLLLVMMAGVMAIGPLSYVRIAVDTASYDCVTAAGRSLDAHQGAYQGVKTAEETLDGFGLLSPSLVGISVTTPNDWTRGEDVVCVVSYDVQLGRIPLASLITGEAVRTVSSTAMGRIEQFKSNW
jgi:Flp pilus assembly protein TadG